MNTFFMRICLYFFVLLTGSAGLIYQVAWQRYVSRLFGSDSIATAIILGTFLGGLSLGYYLVGKFSLRIKKPLALYAILELIIGIWCLAFPWIFKAVSFLSSSWSFAPPFWVLPEGLFCAFLLMGIPTVCMGGTIPLLTRSFSKSLENSTRVHAIIYAVNTVGAFIGVLLAGFYLVPQFGLPRTMMTTSILNFLSFFFFLFLSYKLKLSMDSKEPDTATTEKALQSFSPILLYGIAFLSGFYVMTLENVLIRVVGIAVGSSTYAFSIIVAVFILSIALGSFVIGAKKQFSKSILFFNQLAIAVGLILIYLTLDNWPYVAHLLRISFQGNIAGFWMYYITIFSVLFILLLLPVGMMGATVPIIFHELKQNLKLVGWHSGSILSWNTLGNLLGSLIGGIYLYYIFDVPGIFMMATFLAGISAILASRHLSTQKILVGVTIAIVTVIIAATPGLYRKTNFAVGTFGVRSELPFTYWGASAFFKNLHEQISVPYYNDGPVASIAVTRDNMPMPPFGKRSMALMVNGKSDSSTLGDVYTVRLLAHLPALFATERDSVMVIGLGTGVTVGELSLYPEIKRIDVAEISPAVIKALPLFGEFTHSVHKDSRVKIHQGDAFRIIGRSPKKWNLIISEPSNPWVTGVDALFTKDFYQLAKKHLTEKGIFAQWFHTHATSPEAIGIVVNTMRQVFPELRVFMTGVDILILASQKPLACENLRAAQQTIFSNPKVRASLAEMRLDSLEALLVRECWTSAFIEKYYGQSLLQTLDHPRLHYVAGKDYFKGNAIPMEYFLDERTAAFMEEHLFIWAVAGSCKGLTIPSDTAETNFKLRQSAQDIYTGRNTILSDTIEIRVLSQQAKGSAPSLQKIWQHRLDIIPFIQRYPQDEAAWAMIGLAGASYREKAEVLMNQMRKTRNWLTPYLIEGFFDLLIDGGNHSQNAYEKNWCLLQLLDYLDKEGFLDNTKAQGIVSNLVRTPYGEVILLPEDAHLKRILWNLGLN